MSEFEDVRLQLLLQNKQMKATWVKSTALVQESVRSKQNILVVSGYERDILVDILHGKYGDETNSLLLCQTL